MTVLNINLIRKHKIEGAPRNPGGLNGRIVPASGLEKEGAPLTQESGLDIAGTLVGPGR